MRDQELNMANNVQLVVGGGGGEVASTGEEGVERH